MQDEDADQLGTARIAQGLESLPSGDPPRTSGPHRRVREWGQARTERVAGPRVSPAELEDLEAAAAARNMAVSAYVGAAAVAVARNEVRPAPIGWLELLAPLDGIDHQVQKIGVLINQVATVANSTRNVEVPEITMLMHLYRRWERLLNEVSGVVLDELHATRRRERTDRFPRSPARPPRRREPARPGEPNPRPGPAPQLAEGGRQADDDAGGWRALQGAIEDSEPALSDEEIAEFER